MGLPVQNIDRETIAKNRFIDTMREKANLLSLMSALTDETQSLEDAFFQIFYGFRLSDAVGAQLDAIGETIGEAREGATDTVYRLRIRARVLINLSSGTPNQLIRLVNLLLPAGATAHYSPAYPASFYMDASGAVTDDDAAEIGSALIEATDSGIATGLIYSNVDDDASFLWADSTSLQTSVENGWGSAYRAGEIWTLIEASGSSLNVIATDGTRLIVGGGNAGAYRYSTDNGASWTGATISGYGAGDFISAIATDGAGNWVVGGSHGHGGYSSDGVTFTHVAIVAVVNITCAAWGAGQFVVGGGTFKSSPTGATWSSITNPSGSNVNDVTFASGRFIAVTVNGSIMTSTNGTSWSTVSTGLASGWRKVKYLNGLWIAVGDGGAIATSADGLTWAAQTSGTSEILLTVGYGLGHWVAAGVNGALVSSADGADWDVKTSGFGSTQINRVWGNDVALIAVGNSGKVSASDDADTWVAGTSGFSSSTISDVTEIATVFVAAGAGGKIATSDNFQTGGKLAGIVANT